MTETEMEDLLWEHPEALFGEKLEPFRRQPSSNVGRADLVFRDPAGTLIVVEIKRGVLPRGAISQLLDYYGMVKAEYPDSPVELMVVANHIPKERRLALERNDIEFKEIPERKFRKIASQVGYTFASERPPQVPSGPAENGPFRTEAPSSPPSGPDTPKVGSLDELLWSKGRGAGPAAGELKSWYYLKDPGGRGYFAAFVNAKGSCSLRLFDETAGHLIKKEYASGNFQDAFATIIRDAVTRVSVAIQPNLERAGRTGLDPGLLSDLRSQAGLAPLETKSAPSTHRREVPTIHTVERAWFFHPESGGSFLAFVNAKGSCSLRRFNASNGAFLGRRYADGNFQDAFAAVIEQSREVRVPRQPSLTQAEKEGLPASVVEDLRSQVREV